MEGGWDRFGQGRDSEDGGIFSGVSLTSALTLPLELLKTIDDSITTFDYLKTMTSPDLYVFERLAISTTDGILGARNQ